MKYHFLNQLMYEANPNPAAGGGALPLSLADMANGVTNPPAPTDLAAAAQQQQQTPPADPAKPDAAAGDNADPNKGSGEADDNKDPEVKDPNEAPADGGEGDSDPAAEPPFWESVDQLRGTPLAVEYPEGVDPLSPQGAHIREQAVAKEAWEKFDQYLYDNFPRAYAYMLHNQQGKPDEEFFADKTVNLPAYETFKENQDVQKAVYTQSLYAKGLDEASVKMLVEQAIKDGKLFDKADPAYKAVEKQQADQLARIEAEDQRLRKQKIDSTNATNQNLIDTVNTGNGMSLVIPEADKQPFQQYVRDMIEYDNSTGKFLIVQEFSKETMAKQLEALYFAYKKGNLKDLIQRKAVTETSRRLGQKVEASKKDTKPVASSQNPDPNKNADGTPKFIPLSQI